jgi:hypothetical protein
MYWEEDMQEQLVGDQHPAVAFAEMADGVLKFCDWRSGEVVRSFHDLEMRERQFVQPIH